MKMPFFYFGWYLPFSMIFFIVSNFIICTKAPESWILSDFEVCILVQYLCSMYIFGWFCTQHISLQSQNWKTSRERTAQRNPGTDCSLLVWNRQLKTAVRRALHVYHSSVKESKCSEAVKICEFIISCELLYYTCNTNVHACLINNIGFYFF